MDRAQLQIAREDAPDGLGLRLIDHEGSGARIRRSLVAEGRPAAHPHALLLGSGDLVADAFAGDLSLELGEGEQDVEGQPAHAGGGVEGLGDRDEADLPGVEPLNDASEVRQRTRQPIDFVGQDHIDEPSIDVGQKGPQPWPIHRSAGEAAIVVDLGPDGPALADLRGDIGLACLALGLQAVELLVQALFGGLAGVDGAAELGLDQAGQQETSSVLRPKNRGPFQRVPVIVRATSERLRCLWPWNRKPSPVASTT